MDVALLANVIKHNEGKHKEGKTREKIIIPEKEQRSPMYQDAMLYNAVKDRGQEMAAKDRRMTVVVEAPKRVKPLKRNLDFSKSMSNLTKVIGWER